jgi:hypothetical protein
MFKISGKRFVPGFGMLSFESQEFEVTLEQLMTMFMQMESKKKLEPNEAIYEINGMKIRITNNGMRIDTGAGHLISGDDYHLDFETDEDVRKAAMKLDKFEASEDAKSFDDEYNKLFEP